MKKSTITSLLLSLTVFAGISSSAWALEGEQAKAAATQAYLTYYQVERITNQFCEANQNEMLVIGKVEEAENKADQIRSLVVTLLRRYNRTGFVSQAASQAITSEYTAYQRRMYDTLVGSGWRRSAAADCIDVDNIPATLAMEGIRRNFR